MFAFPFYLMWISELIRNIFHSSWNSFRPTSSSARVSFSLHTRAWPRPTWRGCWRRSSTGASARGGGTWTAATGAWARASSSLSPWSPPSVDYVPFIVLLTWKDIFSSGYGHIHPLTNTGKTACIVYAIIGIPFTLIFLSAIVQRLLAPTFKLLSSFIRMCPNMDTFRVWKEIELSSWVEINTSKINIKIISVSVRPRSILWTKAHFCRFAWSIWLWWARCTFCSPSCCRPSSFGSWSQTGHFSMVSTLCLSPWPPLVSVITSLEITQLWRTTRYIKNKG